ncbi:hypothetical protein TL16_g11239 [Triparma laevis f. inornata]|uniref:Uncharacterized protein n=1 Tax=Triparma laevis f. inornata TaxID=1714386 RepID=A0A9W7BE29_9STRA|nr:hypothetical protein TL16_g11239 [Triparma laevis f. inornata]
MLGPYIFYACFKLVPSNINVTNQTIDPTSEVVAHLRSEMSLNALLSGNNFLNTGDFRRLLVPFLPNDALMTIRLVSKPWSCVADEFIHEGVESGAIIVRGSRDVPWPNNAQKERLKLVKRVIFLQNKLITQVVFLQNVPRVGERACLMAVNLVVVDIPEGVENIGRFAFRGCTSLTAVSFSTTLTSIGAFAFIHCCSLDNFYLLHTNLQELGQGAFAACPELKSMTIPDSLQTLGYHVFYDCSKLVPSKIDVNDYTNNTTSDVVAHLCSQQQQEYFF